MKFDSIVKKYSDKLFVENMLREAPEDGMGISPPHQSPSPIGGGDLGAAAPGTGMPDEMPDEQAKPLSSEGEVMLVRLLKKALVMKIEDDDILEIDSIDDINEGNAKQALETIVDVMNQYSADIDIAI